jgi:hypothetical protein
VKQVGLREENFMDNLITVLDQETGEAIEMSMLAYENLVFFDDKGKYLVL